MYIFVQILGAWIFPLVLLRCNSHRARFPQYLLNPQEFTCHTLYIPVLITSQPWDGGCLRKTLKCFVLFVQSVIISESRTKMSTDSPLYSKNYRMIRLTSKLFKVSKYQLERRLLMLTKVNIKFFNITKCRIICNTVVNLLKATY